MYNEKTKIVMKKFETINVNLRIEIVKWFTENINRWQRVISCMDAFRAYIYDADGNYLIGGKDITEFIKYINEAF